MYGVLAYDETYYVIFIIIRDARIRNERRNWIESDRKNTIWFGAVLGP